MYENDGTVESQVKSRRFDNGFPFFLHTSFPFKALYMRKYIKENNNNNINILKRKRIWKN